MWRKTTPWYDGGGFDGEQIVVLVDGFLLDETSEGGRLVNGRMDSASGRSMIYSDAVIVVL